ncbi:MAG: protein kinase [Polyangiales bacterium]
MDYSEGKSSAATPRAPTGSGSVGPYGIIAPIATGEATVVQLAQKHGALGFHRMAAIKRLKPALTGQAEWRQLLLDAARLSATVHHANVVDIIDVGTDDGAYVVMEYIEGADLDTLLQCAGRERHARYVLPPIVDALQGLHALHTAKDALGEPLALVHQAPRARHILVGIDGTARITDLSQVAAHGLAPSALRRGRLKAGYLAPEQIETPDQVDARTDVFVVGITLWEALTGERLFAVDDAEVSRKAVLERHIPRPSEVGLRPPRCFDAICAKALARKPEQRYQTAAEMARDLREVATHQALYATSGELGQWVRALSARVLLERRHALGADAPSIEMPLDLGEPTSGSAVPTSQVRPTRAIAITGGAAEGSSGGNGVSASGTVPLRSPAAAVPPSSGVPPASPPRTPAPAEPSRVARALTVPVAAPPTRVPPASYPSPAMTLLGVSARPGETPEPSRRVMGGAASTYQVAPERRAGATVPQHGGLELDMSDWPGWTPHAGSPAVAPPPAEPLRGNGFPPPDANARNERRVRVIHFDEPSDAGLRGVGARGPHLDQTDWGDDQGSGGKGLGVLSVVLMGIIVVAGVVGFRQWTAEPAAPTADAPAPDAPSPGLGSAPAPGEPTVTATAPSAIPEPTRPKPEDVEPTRNAALDSEPAPAKAAPVGTQAARPAAAGADATRPSAAPSGAAPKRPAAAQAPSAAPQRVWLPKSAVKAPSSGAAVPPPRPMPNEPASETSGLPRNPYE